MYNMNMAERQACLLNNNWSLLPDPMNRAGNQKWWKSVRPPGEFFPSYDDDAFWPTRVPGAFNRIHDQLAYYEGQVVYLNNFNSSPAVDGERVFLHFEGVADRCKVFLNGRWIGEHDSGFVPFTLDATQALAEKNRLLVYVDNTRQTDGVPGLQHDWWHDGGIHRPVSLYRLPACHIREASVMTTLNDREIELEFAVLVHADNRNHAHSVTCKISDPENGEEKASCRMSAFSGSWSRTRLQIPLESVRLWQPGNPQLYSLEVTVDNDVWKDTVGLRELRTEGRNILLNSSPIVLRGVCTWSEDPECGIFSMSEATADLTIDNLKKLNCNFARTGHAPPSREFVKACDRAGILLWAEVPAYWIPTMHKPTESRRALAMLDAMVRAYRNNPSIGVWCIGNECLYNDTDNGQSNLAYFIEAVDMLHELDPSRFVTYTGGFEGPGNPKLETICPRAIVDKLDIVSINSYSGINDGANPDKPDEFCKHHDKILAAAEFGKPLILGEVGIDAVLGENGFDYGEQRQAAYHQKVQDLFAEHVSKELLQGMTLFVLNDFATPIKLGRFQRGYNRKGLITEKLQPKPAFDVVKAGYEKIAGKK